MSDAREQIDRVIGESERPADATAEDPLEPDLPPDRTRQFRSTSFSRMRTSAIGDDATALARIRATADDVLKDRFKMAYAVRDEIHKRIRKARPVPGSLGEFETYADGSPIWVTNSRGLPVEDWSDLLSDDETLERLLFVITTHLFEWEMAAADLWGEAMYAKVQWEEAFAAGYVAMPGSRISGKPTIDDRTQHGHRFSADERYFAVFRSVLSRQAEALVKSMERLQRTLEKKANR